MSIITWITLFITYNVIEVKIVTYFIVHNNGKQWIYEMSIFTSITLFVMLYTNWRLFLHKNVAGIRKSPIVGSAARESRSPTKIAEDDRARSPVSGSQIEASYLRNMRAFNENPTNCRKSLTTDALTIPLKRGELRESCDC